VSECHLLIHQDLRDHMNWLAYMYQNYPDTPEAYEYVAARKALRALQQGRESEYGGKQLSYGRASHDLRDCAELKVPVFRRFTESGWELGPSHRLIYREFEPIPRITRLDDGTLVPDPDALLFRHVIAFESRDAIPDPAAVAGASLGRVRGIPLRDLVGLGADHPNIGPLRLGMQATPSRIPVPGDLLPAARFLQDQAIARAAAHPPGEHPAARKSASSAKGRQREHRTDRD
jgi:hypothetical protein